MINKSPKHLTSSILERVGGSAVECVGVFFMEEIWKDIPGYEDRYQVSTLGRIKSKRIIFIRKNGIKFTSKGGIKKLITDKFGYKRIGLYKNGKQVIMLVHRLVGICFIKNPKKYTQINHIDFNPSNNYINNLEWCTNRMNSIHSVKSMKKSSKYIGVCWCNTRLKWLSVIRIGKRRINLGRFDSEELAANTYQEKLKQIKNER